MLSGGAKQINDGLPVDTRSQILGPFVVLSPCRIVSPTRVTAIKFSAPRDGSGAGFASRDGDSGAVEAFGEGP
jgi:hypothetical protein